jgi:regulator of replication initiation timing
LASTGSTPAGAPPGGDPSREEVFAAIDALEGEVSERLRALSEALPSARPFVTSVLRDHERHRATRARLRNRLGLPAAAPTRAAAEDLVSLASLRAAQEALVHAHAEGLPALGDEIAVDALARHMVALSRHLTVIDLWIEAEDSRG